MAPGPLARRRRAQLSDPPRMLGLAKKLFGSSNDRKVKAMHGPRRARSTRWSRRSQALSDEQLRGKTDEFRERLAKGETLDDLWTRPSPWCARPPSGRWASATTTCSWSAAWSCTRAASPRCGPAKARPWSPPLPVYLNALAGKGVHVITVNDYLAQRDAEWMGQIYRFLGLTVGVIVHGLSQGQRQDAYGSRHHLRHQQRVRLRLPARQPGLRRRARWSSAATTSRSSTRSTRS